MGKAGEMEGSETGYSFRAVERRGCSVYVVLVNVLPSGASGVEGSRGPVGHTPSTQVRGSPSEPWMPQGGRGAMSTGDKIISGHRVKKELHGEHIHGC